MANGNYTYNPAEIKDKTVSRMRFELGDTMVEGNSDTAALTVKKFRLPLTVTRNHGRKQNSCYWKVCTADSLMRLTQRQVH